MQERRGFSIDTVRRANMMMMLGIKPENSISDKLSREDIKQAWRKASIRVFGGGRDDEQSNETLRNL